jgi:hypothetical protein
MKILIRKLFSQLIPLCGILLLVLGMVQELPLVVCFEPNGQVELEAASWQGACADWQANLRPSQAVKGLLSHCEDVPLFLGKLTLKAATPKSLNWFVSTPLQGFLVAWAHPSFGWMVGIINHNQWAQPPPLSVGLLAFLKTVILLL